MPRCRPLLVAVTIAVAAGGCRGSAPGQVPGLSGPAGATATSTSSSSSTPTTTTITSSTTTAVAGAAPVTTTTAPHPTVTVAAATPFTSTVSVITAADVPSSWRPGCPLAPDQLRLLHLGYWGFDNRPHAGTMVVSAAATGDVVKIFSALYGEHFPIRQMQPVDAYGGSDPMSMEADNTSGFNCRNAVAPGPPHWSVHAFGEAIDVNPVENPYIQGSTVDPPAGAAFVDRSAVRSGMASAGGPLVRAFAGAGWSWGGRWSSADYQHFSRTGG